MEKKGYIHSFESFGLVDGPGVRFVVFFAGCAMRCNFCHNPDTWDMTKGMPMTAQDLLKKALRYKTYWKDNGGITVSGGEPLLQMDFLTDFFCRAKEFGIHTTLDTSGNPFENDESFLLRFDELMRHTDLVLLDIKHIDDAEHKNITKHTNKNILDMARYLSEIKKPVWIRHVLVPGYSDNDDCLERLHDFISTLDNVERVEVLPYHTLGLPKYERLGLDYPLKGVQPPDEERVANANRILHADEYK